METWERRPIEDELQKELDDCNSTLTSTRAKLDRNDHKLGEVANILDHIANTKITIILEDGTVVNNSELANNALDIIKYE